MKLEFLYSQNSINTYKSCPIKFKYKYIDNINWKKFGHKEYYDSLVYGSEFHLVCERFFNDIPLGIDKNSLFYGWIEKIKSVVDTDEGILLPEYEIRFKLDGKNLVAKYDLVIIKENKIEIWDWKTENKKMSYENYKNRIQTIVYLFLGMEVLPKIFDKNIDYQDISMNYYQMEFDDEPKKIVHSKENHFRYKEIIKNYINSIENNNFYKNTNHCKYCELENICKGI